MKLLPIIGLLLASVGCFRTADSAPTSSPVLRLAVTTSTRDSSLLDVLVPVFEKQHGARVDVIGVGTGAALKLGESGDVDLALVHAREAEDAFMQAGHGVRREDVMYNTFEIVGPDNDPGKIRGLDAASALRKIADDRQRFVSRGDDSGTHKRELKLWNEAGVVPDWDGYVESGQGMGATLIMADQMNAYVLVDGATYLKFRKRIQLVPLIDSSPGLHNPYGIIVVDPGKNEAINSELANAFVDFMISQESQKRIAGYRIDGQQLFFPGIHPTEQN